ncbi:MAG: UDP-N-acetylmuramoyl-L-alanine--D-glutamate ligase [Deltaproteobacteria bacterium]|nr:UDP-N-acetylmuramoyl-L-alanine--D-glutamate ligase [Deltaproteobacteria bacterium]
MMNVRGRHILIVGLGKSGIAAARFVAQAGALVTVTDRREEASLREACAALASWPMTFHCGGHAEADFLGAELIIVSPGVPLTLPPLQAARQRGIPIVGEMELALPYVHCPLVAIIGTNGKSTTTKLAGDLFRQHGEAVVVGGNIGVPLLEVTEQLTTATRVVLEVSSYQVEITPHLHPAITVLLNVTPDHLDRYPNFAAYMAAKKALIDRLGETDTVITNRRDPIAAEMAGTSRARPLFFNAVHRELPEHDHACWDGKRIHVRLPGQPAMTIPCHHPAMAVRHLCENFLAAALVGALARVPAATMTVAMDRFAMLPHRCQLVSEWQGIRFYDDSKGTNVGAVACALESIAGPIVLIAGGEDKETGFEALQGPVQRWVKHLVLLGQAREVMAQALSSSAPVTRVTTMHEAVRAAMAVAERGDAILLSPACASFDMYANYAERGRDFVQCVQTCTGHAGTGH